MPSFNNPEQVIKEQQEKAELFAESKLRNEKRINAIVWGAIGVSFVAFILFTKEAAQQT